MKQFSDEFDEHRKRIIYKIEERLDPVNKQYEKLVNDLGKK